MTDRPMRRAERQVDDPARLADLVAATRVCRVGFIDDGEPYVVPLNFGAEWLADGRPRFWFHSAPDGRKAELIASEPLVCVQLDRDLGMVTHPDKACAWTQHFESLMAWGVARAARDEAEARHGLDVLMRQHAGRDGWSYPDAMLDITLVWTVTADRLTTKAHTGKTDDV